MPAPQTSGWRSRPARPVPGLDPSRSSVSGLASTTVETESAYVAKYKLADGPGCFQATESEANHHMWRVSTLRNLVYTAPYFHNGSVKSLDEAVQVMAETQLDQDLSRVQVGDVPTQLTIAPQSQS